MKKILILESLGSDYGAYFLTHGFVQLLGAENVRMWPCKKNNNGGIDTYPERVVNGDVLQVKDNRVVYDKYFTGSEMWAHKELWRFWKPEKNIPGVNLPSTTPVSHTRPLNIPESSDDEIMSMIKNNNFSCVVMNGTRWHNSAALHELQSTIPNLPPVVIVDHDDYPQRRWDFYDTFKPALYFKRTFIVNGHPHDNILGNRDDVKIRPFPFSSMWNAEWIPWKQRDIDVFCIFGPTQFARAELRRITLEIAKKFPECKVRSDLGHPMNHQEYFSTLARAKIVIDQQTIGTDTLRFWEASSVGTCVISDFNIYTPPEEIIPDVDFYKYDNDQSILTGQPQDFSVFRIKLEKAIKDNKETELMARRMYEKVKKYHTTKARAQYIINELKNIGLYK